jgi:hypothetical protein
MTMRTGLMMALLLAGCSATSRAPIVVQPAPTAAPAAPEFVYVWGTAVDTFVSPPVAPDTIARARRRGVVLLTIDLREKSETRGRVTDVILADSGGRGAHHTEHALADDGILFANDFGRGVTSIFDLRTAGQPKLLGHFTTAGDFAYPHSFVPLANGNVLATYQWGHGYNQPPGGLAELRRDGSVVRSARAAVTGFDSTQIVPYSLEVLPALDRVVTTSTSMVADGGVLVQIWRLSDLTVLHTLEIPAAPTHAGHDVHGNAPAHGETHHLLPGEPRLLADGRTVMFGTFTCGLYRLDGIDSNAPRLSFMQAFPGEDCAVPLRIGERWIQTVPAERALVVLDIGNPAAPRELSRLVFDAPVKPHWLSADRTGQHLVLTSGSAADGYVHFASFDEASGRLARDARLPFVDVSRVTLPGVGVVQVIPHGAVFSNGR